MTTAVSGSRRLGADKREYLSGLTYTRQEIDEWFAGSAYPFSKYDSELGYLYCSGRRRDGVDGST